MTRRGTFPPSSGCLLSPDTLDMTVSCQQIGREEGVAVSGGDRCDLCYFSIDRSRSDGRLGRRFPTPLRVAAEPEFPNRR